MTSPSLPTNDQEVWTWIILLMAGHLAAVYVMRGIRGKVVFSDQSLQALISRIFDAGTFATSIMLLIGVPHKEILKAIGGTEPFLIFAGFAGTVYGIHALAKSD